MMHYNSNCVMVIVLGNGYGNLRSDPEQAILHFSWVNTYI